MFQGSVEGLVLDCEMAFIESPDLSMYSTTVALKI